MDAWHVATVAVLAVALGGEVIGAYGKQRRLFEEQFRETSESLRAAQGSIGAWGIRVPVFRWAWFWFGKDGEFRFGESTVEFCAFLRGSTRLIVLTYIVIHFAVEQEFPWSSWFGG